MIDSTVAQLLAISNSPIDKVGQAINLAAVVDQPPKRGVECHVVPISENPRTNKRVTGKFLQEVDVIFGVVIGIRTLNDPDGQRSKDRLKPIRDVVRDAIYNADWKPTGATAHCLLGRSDLVKLVPGGVWWLDRFVTKTQRKQL